MAVPMLFGARLSRLRARHCPKHDQFCLCSDRVRQDWLSLCYRWGSAGQGTWPRSQSRRVEKVWVRLELARGKHRWEGRVGGAGPAARGFEAPPRVCLQGARRQEVIGDVTDGA